MKLTINEREYLLARKEEIQQEIRALRHQRGPRYYEGNDRRVELMDELSRIEVELQNAQLE